MNKLIGLAALAAILSVSVAAFADNAEYIGGNSDEAIVTSSDNYETIIITKASDKEIVYMNQTNDTYNGEVHFLVKNDPDYGKYNVLLGSSTGSEKNMYFYVGVDPLTTGDAAMTRLQGEEMNSDGTYNVAYYTTVKADDYNDFETIKVVRVDSENNVKYGMFDLKTEDYPQTSGDGDVNLIFQINYVPAESVDSVSVFLSNDNMPE